MVRLTQSADQRRLRCVSFVPISVNQAVNAFLEIPPRSRREPSSEELERALSELDAIGDTVQAEVTRRVAA